MQIETGNYLKGLGFVLLVAFIFSSIIMGVGEAFRNTHLLTVENLTGVDRSNTFTADNDTDVLYGDNTNYTYCVTPTFYNITDVANAIDVTTDATTSTASNCYVIFADYLKDENIEVNYSAVKAVVVPNEEPTLLGTFITLAEFMTILFTVYVVFASITGKNWF